MARIETDPNYTAPTFSRATVGTDLFKKEDVQGLAAAMSTHTHGTGKGVALEASAVPNGLITSAMIADGTVDTVDLKDGSVTNAKLGAGSVTSDKLAAGAIASSNLLTNPSFETWQRGNGPFTTSGVINADRWHSNMIGGDTFNCSRDTANRDTALGGNACAVVNFVLSGGAGTSTIRQMLAHTEHGLGGTMSFSIRVRTSTASAARAWFHNGTAATMGPFHTGGGAWETLTMTVTPGTGGGYNYFGVAFAASCTAYLDNAMLTQGSVPGNYVPLHPADDLARCQRYYEVDNHGNGQTIGTIMGSGTNLAGIKFPFKVTKAVTPTVTNVGGFNMQIGNGSASAITIGWVPTLDHAIMNGSGGATNATMYSVHASGTTKVISEANP